MSEEKIEMTSEQDEKVTQEQIAAWKAEFGKMFKTVFGPYEFYWHPLNRKTYSEMMSDTAEIEELEDRIEERRYQSILRSVVYPGTEEVATVLKDKYGILNSFPDIILEKSGFYQGETSEL